MNKIEDVRLFEVEIGRKYILEIKSSEFLSQEDFNKMLKTIYYQYILKRKAKSSDNSDKEIISPFENAKGKEILSAIEKHFTIDKIQYFGAFSEEACRSLNLPQILRVPSILFLSWFDYFWVKSKLLEGKLMLGYARKS